MKVFFDAEAFNSSKRHRETWEENQISTKEKLLGAAFPLGEFEKSENDPDVRYLSKLQYLI